MNNSRVDFNLLNVFQAVMAELNVTRAAHRLAMTQPAASNALKRLRLLFRDELFVKVPGGVAPTERARILWAELESPMSVIGSAVSQKRFNPAASGRLFSVAITESLAGVVVPRVASRFAEHAPEAKLRFLPHSNPASLAALERGELDCAVGMFPHIPPTLRLEALLSDEYVCAWAKSHRPVRFPLTLQAYAAARHVHVRQSPVGTGIIDDWLSLQGMKRDIVVTVNSCADALTTVVDTDFVTAVPKRFLQRYQGSAQKKVSTGPLPLDGEKILYKLVWHERTEREPGQIWLRSLVGDVVRLVRGEGDPA